jgi:hypothetical protein
VRVPASQYENTAHSPAPGSHGSPRAFASRHSLGELSPWAGCVLTQRNLSLHSALSVQGRPEPFRSTHRPSWQYVLEFGSHCTAALQMPPSPT